MRRRAAGALLVVTALIACSSLQSEVLTVPNPADDGELGEDQPRANSTWRDLPALPTSTPKTRILVTADTGRRTEDNTPHPDALLVRDAAAHACAGTCKAAWFLGDNVYPRGINEARDVEYLERFVDAYLDGPEPVGEGLSPSTPPGTAELAAGGAGGATGSFEPVQPTVQSGVVEEIFFTQGNHDWGPYFPRRRRAQALHDAIDEFGPRVHGAAHFHAAKVGDLRVVSFDSNFVVHQCEAVPELPLPQSPRYEDADLYRRAGLACLTPGKETPGIDLPTLSAWTTSGCPPEQGSCRSSTVVVGHHPWFSNGRHGTAGYYRDFAGTSIGRGKSYRVVLERVVAPNAALYLSGHDHGVQAHWRGGGLEQLSVVVGSGSKVSPPGRKTRPDERYHQSGMVLEAFCRLGFALVEATDEGLVVEVWSLQGSETASCSERIDARRGPVTSSLGRLDAAFGHDLRCRAFSFSGGHWRAQECAVGPVSEDSP